MNTDDALHIQRPLAWQLLAEFSPSIGPCSEHQAAEQIAGVARELGLRPVQIGRIRQMIVDALCSAMTRGKQGQRNLPVSIRIWVMGAYAQDCSRSNPDALQNGRQEHRGWGFFVVEKRGDDLRAFDLESRHIIELFLYDEGALEKREWA